ncbi:hypothetical protein H2200_005929 [Cladophialophora chaetospira]|uniref:Uncharacterized protein n=1 Tax=Cladophialophora chaetospira TaxID=386627 RepID=A0AA39CIK6_9EURO|nr:hypothetical protein H2200_005929 [Cladophialophora chaetospira]
MTRGNVENSNLGSTPQASANSSENQNALEEQVSETGTSTTVPPVNSTTLNKFVSLTRRDARERLDEPPALPFDVRHHKTSVAIFTFLVVAECCIVPLALYYALKYTTNMRSGIYFAIITSLFGFVTGYEFGIRAWRLIRPSDEYRPLFGSPRFWGFDSTHFVLTIPFTVMLIILIIFSIPHHPSVPALATPMPVGMIVTGVMFVINGWAAQRRWRLMYFRLSSHVKNSICPPLTFCLLEDICAVDGKGGKKYRTAALARYHASPRFRALLLQLLWFWSIPAIVIGVVLVIVIFLTSDDVAYGVGWGAPTIWALVWTWITVGWVQRALQVEKELWKTEISRVA